MVGAGYTGTEVAAQGVLVTGRCAGIRDCAARTARWLLVDTADRVLPGLRERLSGPPTACCAERGVEIRTGTSVKEATDDGVLLSDGSTVPTRSLIWCVGVRPDPLVETLGLPTDRGRLVVDETCRCPASPDCGRAATRPRCPT